MIEEGLPTKRIIVSLSDKGANVDRIWEKIRQEYSAKQLTKATDKLTAFSGIARMVHKKLKSAPEEYCAGLWKPSLLTELLWERHTYQDSDQVPGVYIAPSWSWASLNGSFRMPQYVSDRAHRLVAVIETRVQHIEDIFGPVRGACLVLRCSLCPVTLTVVECDDISHGITRIESEGKLTQIDGTSVKYSSHIVLDYPGEAARAGNSWCYSMPMLEYRGLIYGRLSMQGMLLKPTGALKGPYYRIGVLSVFYHKEDPDIMAMVQGRDCEFENLYIDNQENGSGTIEII
ncbi:MAG: hypothetical protein Q9223_000792 [Gallowayella weberi]